MADRMKSKLVPVAPKSGASKKASSRQAPITRVSVSSIKGVERSVSVREISNGYLINESTYGPRGYKETVTYSKTAPKIDVAAIAKGKK
jgi:hypothetical protein